METSIHPSFFILDLQVDKKKRFFLLKKILLLPATMFAFHTNLSNQRVSTHWLGGKVMNEEINESKRSRVRSPARASLKK
jgi:hypothetical protein